MTLRNHLHSFFGGVHRGGRYRSFTGLERHADRPPKRASAKRRRLRIGLIAATAAAALSFGVPPGKQARSETRSSPDEAAQPATQQPRPIPEAGPLAQPKSLEQVGLPAELTRQAIPPDNPQTPDKITLGEKLFFDGRLSAEGTVACSTCHDPARAFTDGRPTSIGINGRVGQRNAPTILNVLYNKTQFWDGRVKTLEEQAALPIVNPHEMGQPSMDAAVAKIAAVDEYKEAFQQVFGRPPNGPDLVRAIASYERTQILFDSPFDHFIAGEKNAINDSAKRGWGVSGSSNPSGKVPILPSIGASCCLSFGA